MPALLVRPGRVPRIVAALRSGIAYCIQNLECNFQPMDCHSGPAGGSMQQARRLLLRIRSGPALVQFSRMFCWSQSSVPNRWSRIPLFLPTRAFWSRYFLLPRDVPLSEVCVVLNTEMPANGSPTLTDEPRMLFVPANSVTFSTVIRRAVGLLLHLYTEHLSLRYSGTVSLTKRAEYAAGDYGCRAQVIVSVCNACGRVLRSVITGM